MENTIEITKTLIGQLIDQYKEGIIKTRELTPLDEDVNIAIMVKLKAHGAVDVRLQYEKKMKNVHHDLAKDAFTDVTKRLAEVCNEK